MMLTTKKTIRRNWLVEEKLRRESLAGTQGFGDRADCVLRNAQIIIKCRGGIIEQKADKAPNKKVIEKCQDIIINCTTSFKDALVKLGADENCVKTAEMHLANNDIDQIKFVVLQLLAARNPGMYAKKCKLFGQYIAQRG